MKIEVGDLVNYYSVDWDVTDNYEPTICIVYEINKLVSTPEDNYDTEICLLPFVGNTITYIPDIDNSYIEKVSK